MASIPMAFESPPRRGRSTKPDWNDRRPCRSMTSPSNRESPSSREIKSCRSPKETRRSGFFEMKSLSNWSYKENAGFLYWLRPPHGVTLTAEEKATNCSELNSSISLRRAVTWDGSRGHSPSRVAEVAMASLSAIARAVALVVVTLLTQGAEPEAPQQQ